MNPSPISIWPPIIRANAVPMWVRVRDILITLLAWLTIGVTIHNLLWLIYDYLADPIFQLSYIASPDWELMWHLLSQFLYVALGMVVWICFLALLRRKIINSTKYIRVSTKAHEIRDLEVELGVLPADVEHWHELRSVHVYISQNGKTFKIVSDLD
jgi:hypothetical protein